MLVSSWQQYEPIGGCLDSALKNLLNKLGVIKEPQYFNIASYRRVGSALEVHVVMTVPSKSPNASLFLPAGFTIDHARLLSKPWCTVHGSHLIGQIPII